MIAVEDGMVGFSVFSLRSISLTVHANPLAKAERSGLTSDDERRSQVRTQLRFKITNMQENVS